MSDSYKNYFIRNMKKIVAKLGNVALLDEISENNLSAALAKKINTSSSGDGIAKAYIVGSTPFAADWLSKTAGGTALTPTAGDVYLILTSGAYQYSLVIYNGTTYVDITNVDDEITKAYIVGSTSFAADWLSETAGGTALTPTTNNVYLILTSGTYQYMLYIYDGSAYVPITSEGINIWEGTAAQYLSLLSVSDDTLYIFTDGSELEDFYEMDVTSSTSVSPANYTLNNAYLKVENGRYTLTLNATKVSGEMKKSVYFYIRNPFLNKVITETSSMSIVARRTSQSTLASKSLSNGLLTIEIDPTYGKTYKGNVDIDLGGNTNYALSIESPLMLLGSKMVGGNNPEIGDLEDLTTTEKNTLVGAINEINKITPLTQGEVVVLGEWTNQTAQAIANGIYAIASNMDESSLNSSYILMNGHKFIFNGDTTNDNVRAIRYVSTDATTNYVGSNVFVCKSDGTGELVVSGETQGNISVTTYTTGITLNAQLCKQVGMTAAEDGEVVLATATATGNNALNSFVPIYSMLEEDVRIDTYIRWENTILRFSGYGIVNGYKIVKYEGVEGSQNTISIYTAYLKEDGSSIFTQFKYDASGGGTFTNLSSTTDTFEFCKRLSPSAKETVVARFTGNGSKTISQYFDEMFANVSAINLSGRAYLRQSSTQHPGYIYYKLTGTWDNEYMFERTTVSGGVIKERIINMRANSSFYKEWDGSNAADYSNNVMSTSETFELIL